MKGLPEHRKAPNTFLEDLYNKLTYLTVLYSSRIVPDSDHEQSELSPLWITGLFRSGTSITTHIVNKLGIDIGPPNDLLLPIGFRKNLNPEGFYENYLVMDLSLHIFKLLNGWGDCPPSPDAVKNFKLTAINYKNFVHDSIVNIHDDRISNKNKSRILRNYFSGNLGSYFMNNFNENFAVKNPHFCLLHPIFDNLFPKGRYLVVFRNPDQVIRSAQQISTKTDYELYYSYYSNMVNHNSAIFFDYNQLISNPEGSIKALANALGQNITDNSIYGLVKATQQDVLVESTFPENVQQLYDLLKSKAINAK